MAKGKYHDWLTEDGLLQLKGWARDGLDDKEIADKMGINRSTLYDWIRRFSTISNTIKEGRKPIVIAVENTFFEKKLNGYFVDEEVTEITEHPNGGQTKHKRITKRYIPPDTTAMIFYLKCRKPDVYNDRLAVTVKADGDGKLADLIEGLKDNEYKDELYSEAEEIDGDVAD